MHIDEGRVCLDNQMVAVFAWISPKLLQVPLCHYHTALQQL